MEVVPTPKVPCVNNQKVSAASEIFDPDRFECAAMPSRAEVWRATMPSKADFDLRQREHAASLHESFLTKSFVAQSFDDNAHLFSKIGICACLQTLATSPELFPLRQERRTVLDLGSGSGRPILALAATGWRALGVDLFSPCVNEARINIACAESKGFIQPGLAQVFHGNFFPKNITVARLANGPADPRSDYLKTLAAKAPSWEEVSERYSVSHRDIDLFYHYQVERISNIITFFSACSRPGALLAIAVSFFEDPPTIPNNLAFLGGCGPAGHPGEPIAVFQNIGYAP